MSTWDLICKPFVENKLEELDEFSYFDFVERFKDKDQDIIDLYYVRALNDIASYKTELTKHCHVLKKEFSKRNNKRAKFGKEYLEYWDDLNTLAHENRMRKRAFELEENIQRRVIQKVNESFASRSPSVEAVVEAQEVEEEKNWTDKVLEILNETKHVPTYILSNLNILDSRNKSLMKLVKKKLTEEEYNFLNDSTKLSDWIADDTTKELLKLINNASPVYHSLRVVSRTQLIPPKEFDSALYHNLLTVEYIFTHFLNSLEFIGPLITQEHYERTGAVLVVVPVMNALLMNYPSLSTKWFEIQTKFTHRHLFDGVVFYNNALEPMVLAEFGSSHCDADKSNKDTVKVYRNATRVINELASKVKKGTIPKVFILLFHKAKLSFETLTLIDNCTYVRTRHAKVKAPTTPEELKLVFDNIDEVFSWRDALVQNIAYMPDSNSDFSSRSDAYDTLTVSSTP